MPLRRMLGIEKRPLMGLALPGSPAGEGWLARGSFTADPKGPALLEGVAGGPPAAPPSDDEDAAEEGGSCFAGVEADELKGVTADCLYWLRICARAIAATVRASMRGRGVDAE